ncbi:hypothetical protein ACT8ZV_22075 [Nocardioides sp. MAHUQ-72]|uniref:hypothetical protein n=1 Tax=unclassified Nocardioides TaxID=2615069 RepID=UPI0036068A79
MHLRRSPRRPLRRSLALAVGGIVLATPVLTSCGFNYATDRVYTPANGVNDRDASVDVLGAVIVSGQDDSGTFIATFSNNDTEKENTVESLDGAGDSPIQSGSFSPITIDAGGLVNLATDGGIPVSGTFKAGNFVPVTVTFGSGEKAEMKVPVVTDTDIYEGLDTSASESATPSTGESATPSESATESPSSSPSE